MEKSTSHTNFKVLAVTCGFLFIIIEVVVYDLSTFKEPAPKVTQQQFVTVQWFENDGRRLGNELFAFAASFGVGDHYGLSVLVSHDMEITQIFQLEGVHVTENQAATLGSHVQYGEPQEMTCKYSERILHIPFDRSKQGLRMSGYFQSWRYFANVTDELRNVLTFKPHITRAARELLDQGLRNAGLSSLDNITLIGLHVRRGDILKKKNFGYVDTPVGYFERAVKFLELDRNSWGSNSVFVMCSNDMPWIKSNLAHLHKYIIYSESNSSAVDLALLSMSDHVIISTGSYGWWGAWLANRTTIYYNDWPRKNSTLDARVNKSEYFPPNWIPMT